MSSDVKVRVAAAIEHTLLKAEARPAAVDAICDEAATHGFHGVCVNPLHVARAARRLDGKGPCVVSVVGFPLGASKEATVAVEAKAAVADGASEIDMVIPVGLALDGDHAAITTTVAVVRDAIPGVPLKVILETGHFDAAAIEAIARAAAAGGPDFLKTSTGFGPRGATVDDVAILARVGQASTSASGAPIAVKAAGGVRDLAGAVAMLDAGATRLGTSSGVAIIQGAEARGGY